MQVGNTPLIKLSDKLYAKYEALNPGGSIKDRPVKYILDDAEERGLLKRGSGQTIAEATSGNTGISLAMMCAERGYKCQIVMPSDMSEERKKIMKFFGARLYEVEAGNFDEAIKVKNDMCAYNGWFTLEQFDNNLNIQCHRDTTFQEIMNQTNEHIDAFILGTGTGGTLMGIATGVQEWDMAPTKIVAVEPAESPVMSGGEKGLHGIQGIGDGSKFLVDMDFIDDVITISTEEAKRRALHLARYNGLFVGISAGANVLAAEQWIEKNNPDGIVVTILCDRGERYFSVLGGYDE